MIEGAVGLVEAGVAILYGVFEFSVLMVVSSIRPWGYALSSKYRSKVAAELEGRHPLYRAFYFAWGTFALVGSIAVVAGVWWVYSHRAIHEPPSPRNLGDKVLHLKEKA